MRILAVLALIALAAPARAAERENQIAGLFMQACVAHAGDVAGLRRWAQTTKLPVLPPPAQAVFLHGAPGTAYDATNESGGKLVMVAQTDGSCEVAAPGADFSALSAALESYLASNGISATQDDATDQGVTVRTYGARTAARAWRLTVTAALGDPRAPVLLGAEALPIR